MEASKNSIQLKNEQLSAVVSTAGGWLERFDIAEKPVLSPLQLVGEKKRGGCHVCVPNFGPGGDSGLPQHGFGRTEVWQVVEQSAHRVVLALNAAESGYEGLALQLVYELSDRCLSMALRARNDSAQPLRLAPAFHPYFANAGGETVSIDGQDYSVDQLADTVLLTTAPRGIQTIAGSYLVESQGLLQWVLWSDAAADRGYVCLEPTQSGNSFADGAVQPEELLAPAASAEWSMTIRV